MHERILCTWSITKETPNSAQGHRSKSTRLNQRRIARLCEPVIAVNTIGIKHVSDGAHIRGNGGFTIVNTTTCLRRNA